MKRLYFVRHGQTDMNVSGHMSGTSNAQLTDDGKAQATAAGQWARDNGLVFDVILASPQDRAKHTAQHIARQVDYDLDGIITHHDLRERDFGVAEGVHHLEVDGFMERAENPFSMDHIQDIETVMDLQYRAKQVLEHLHTLPHETILVVSHGVFGRALRRAIQNTPITEHGEALQNAQIVQLI